ncbi:MAG: ABC transporter substrate-binding protein, partial [Spirochaetales bacterium]
EDIAFNFSEERVWGADPAIPRGPTYFGTFSKVEAIGPYTVRIETRVPDPAFLKRFTTPLGFVVPKDYYQELGMEEFNLAPVGTGPYRFAEFQPDEYVRLEAFDDYWGGTPPAKSITFYEIPEFAGRITALFNGEVDLIANVPPDQISTVENRSGFEVRDVLIDNYRVMVMRTVDPVNPQMADARIRQALAYAIDRQLIVDQLWQGYSKVPVIGVFPGHAEYYLDEREPFPYDPERARELLDEAGYDGEEFLYGISGGYYVNYLESAQIMQEMWKEVGINVRIEIRETGNLDEPFDLASWSDGMQMNDPLHTAWAQYEPRSPRGRDGSQSQKWDPTEEYLDLGEQLNTTIDFESRRAAFRQMIDTLESEMISLPLFQAVEFYAIRSDIEWKPYSFWPMDLGPNNLRFLDN